MTELRQPANHVLIACDVESGNFEMDIVGRVKIDLSEVESFADRPTTARFPPERPKALLALLILLAAALLNDMVLAYIHERVPESPPLPDVIFDITPYMPWTLAISEYLILFSCLLMFSVCILHKHRWILFRRVFFITSLLYFMRALCIFVTQVPVADPNYYCSPKLGLNKTGVFVIFGRAFTLISGIGLKINGKHTLCGDYIYSGHTVVLVMAFLVFQEYSPKRWWPLHWLAWLVCAVGIVCILLSRGHYSIDVLIAYWVTTRLFWLYHTMAANPVLKERCRSNYLSRVCWFSLFRFMEANVAEVLPRRFECPFQPSWHNLIHFNRCSAQLKANQH